MTAPRVVFSTFRIRQSGTDKVLELGTLAGAPALTLDGRKACEFPSAMLAALVCVKLNDRLNAPAVLLGLPAIWQLEPVKVEHEKVDDWAALHRFDRTALESAYFLADVLPSWVRK